MQKSPSVATQPVTANELSGIRTLRFKARSSGTQTFAGNAEKRPFSVPATDRVVLVVSDPSALRNIFSAPRRDLRGAERSASFSRRCVGHAEGLSRRGRGNPGVD